jgi:hypothetical protein
VVGRPVVEACSKWAKCIIPAIALNLAHYIVHREENIGQSSPEVSVSPPTPTNTTKHFVPHPPIFVTSILCHPSSSRPLSSSQGSREAGQPMPHRRRVKGGGQESSHTALSLQMLPTPTYLWIALQRGIGRATDIFSKFVIEGKRLVVYDS